ncbi:MAG: hypothetical protein K2G70_05930 [Turicibacter sp.]|nr:hypothetical protein [Turicibacter sp.]
MLELNPSKARTFILSNDAFFYLLGEEDPIDEDNLEEAHEIIALFPNGFDIKDNWRYVSEDENDYEPGCIQATFIPYCKPDYVFDSYLQLSKNYILRLKWIDKDHIKVWRFNSITGESSIYGEFFVKTNEYKKRYFVKYDSEISDKFSTFFIDRFIQVNK